MQNGRSGDLVWSPLISGYQYTSWLPKTLPCLSYSIWGHSGDIANGSPCGNSGASGSAEPQDQPGVRGGIAHRNKS